MRSQPAYVCAILLDRHGRLLMERRYPKQSLAARHLTCFGGGREFHEQPLMALRRELREELAWCPSRFGPSIDLYVLRSWIARFYLVKLDAFPAVPQRGPGGWPDTIPVAQFNHPTVSRWHREVLRAWRSGRRRVTLRS
ncbi:MAG: NUDIX domain-containing protein [Planctomycetota bacterium]|nr:NUDIX domain-containing protein [Planctomycetota bacterium]